MTIEKFLKKWLKQPGTFITQPEREFISDMRKAARHGVGYGWMKQMIDIEWQSIRELYHDPDQR